MQPKNKSQPPETTDGDWLKLDVAAHHGIAGRLIAALKPHTESDPVALLVQFLTLFGNAAGGAMHLMIDGARHALILFVVLVGVTSKGRKGTSLKRVLSVFRNADQHWTENCLAGGVVSGEGVVFHLRDPSDKDPGVPDKRLAAIEPEYSSLIKVCARNTNTASDTIRKAWDGDTLRTLARNNPLRATDPHLSIVGHITEGELKSLMSSISQANGYGNRFVHFMVRRSQFLPFPTQPDPNEIQALNADIGRALDHARKHGLLEFDDEARKLWIEKYPDLSSEKPGLLGAMTARAEAQVMRLAAIYAALDSTHIISPVHLRAALAVWDYSAASVQKIFGDSIGDPDADAILSALRAQPEGLARTDISALFGRNLSADRIARALLVLQANKLARFEQLRTGGRSREIWFALEKPR